MKKINFKSEKENGKKPVDYLLSFFLAVSIIFSIIIVSNCNNKSDNITPVLDDTTPPDFGGSESTSIITSLFKSAADGAAGDIGGAAAGWAMSALGLSAASPNYTEELDKIDSDLQQIINELSSIDSTLNQIYGELTVINCTEWSTGLTSEKSRIDALMQNYNTLVATAKNGGNVTQAEISDWVDQVMATGSYTSQMPMNQILAEFADQLYVPISSGIIPACVQTLTAPTENSFGSDTAYYNLVAQYTNYYYAYQVKGLTLLNEALHYKAWQAAGSPNSDSLSSDSTSYVCSNPNAVLFCNESAAAVNTLYNNLIVQLTAGGAPYSGENFILEYQQAGPILWPLSLENFTIAAGDNCTDPLNSYKPCGVTVATYNNQNMGSVTYKGYSGWLAATNVELNALLTGWSSGRAGGFLQNMRGFKNMNNKIILSSSSTTISLAQSCSNQDVIIFIDTETQKSQLSGLLFDNSAAFNGLLQIQETMGNGVCVPIVSNFYYYTGKVAGTNSPFYGSSYGVSQWCDGQCARAVTWSNPPPWLTSPNPYSYQFRWPVSNVSTFKCTEGRSSKNPGSVWTMCGNDFTAWFDYYVPRPVTCSNPGAGVTCSLSATAVANAKEIVGRQTIR